MEPNQAKPFKVSELGENAFPKISGKRVDFLSQLQQLADAGRLPPMLDIEGTVKLHGMHADIVFNLRNLPIASQESSRPQPQGTRDSENDTKNAILGLSDQPSTTFAPKLDVTFQSRNKVCDPNASTHGWPRNIAKLPDALVYLRDRIITRYQEKIPNIPIDRSYPLIVGGEWIGPKVQQDVGVSQLSHRFIILTIQINGQWQRDSDYDDIEAAKADIYSIFRAGQRILKLDTTNLTDTNPVFLEMQKIADEVEASCPFAASFGINNSQGEGVVWKPGCPEGRADPKLWFKTKGPISGPENRIDDASIAADTEKRANIDEVCARFVSPRRIEQGFEYLLEMNLKPDRQSVKVFTNWIANDVLVEEKTEIEEMEKRWKGVKAVIRKKVMWLARCAFIEQMEKCGVSIA